MGQSSVVGTKWTGGVEWTGTHVRSAMPSNLDEGCRLEGPAMLRRQRAEKED